MAVTLPGVYTFIAEFQNISDPSIQWRNTIEFRSNTVPLVTDPIVTALNEFFMRMVHPDVNYVKRSVYNWARGAQPYPQGLPLFTDSTVVQGIADSTWGSALGPTYSPTGGEVCMRVDHETSSQGKPGRNFFRGLLGEENVAALSAGKWFLLIAIAVLQTILDNITSTTGLNSFFGAGSGGVQLGVVRYSAKHATTPTFSPMTSMRIMGVTTNKRTRKSKK